MRKHRNRGVCLDEEEQYDGRDWFDGMDIYEGRDWYKRRERMDDLTRFNRKLDIQDFEGRMHLDDFLDWLSTMKRIFEYYDPLEHKKVKLVAIKLQKHMSFKWENFKRQCDKEGRSRIVTQEKMKRELRRKWVQEGVEDYTVEFDQLMLKDEFEELEEHTIAKHLSKLKYKIVNVVNLQSVFPYMML